MINKNMMEVLSIQDKINDKNIFYGYISTFSHVESNLSIH